MRLDRIYEAEEALPDIFTYFMKKYELGWGIVKELLSQGIKEDVFEDVNPSLVIQLLIRSMKMLCQDNFQTENHITYQEGLKQMVNIIIKGISK